MKAYFKGWLMVLVLALGPLVMITLASQPARAAGPWYVAPGGDDGNDCLGAGAACATINGALGKADPADTIYVATGTYTGTGDEVVLLDKDVTLSGGWDGTFTTQSGTSTIDGEDARRGMTVNSGVTAIVEHFVVQNGSSVDGGGIYNGGGTLTLTNSAVSGNTASAAFYASYGGGIYNHGTLTLTDSTVRDNTVSAADSYGGGIYNHGTLTLTDSTVSGNTASPSEFSYGGGIHNHYGTLTLTDSTVSGNTASSLNEVSYGGGISNYHGTLTLNNSTVSGNTVSSSSFPSYGCGIYNYHGTLTLTDSTVTGNTASSINEVSYGGGIYSFDTTSTVTLTNSAVSDNSAHYGGGIYNGGGTLMLTNSAVTGNTASSASHPSYGGGIYSSGATSTVTLTNSTVSGNTASSPPYLSYGGGISNYYGTLTLTNGTLSDNSADYGGGIVSSIGSATLKNTIVANSPSGGNCYGSITSSGRNLDSGNTCGFSGPGDLINTDPLLGPLQDNGGPTETHALLPGSPAIDAGDDSACPATDQRGEPRPADGDGDGTATCDIGAFEYVPPSSLTIVKELDPTSDPGKFDLQIDGNIVEDEAGHGDSTGAVEVSTGTHTVGETADDETSLGDYSTTISCQNAQGAVTATPENGATWSVEVGADRDIVCTITNSRRGKIVIEKVTDPSPDPTSTSFAFTAGGGLSPTTFSLKDDESQAFDNLLPGSGYSITETVPSGWDLISATCSDDSPVDNINVSPDETVTCTFTNEAIAPTLTVIKEVINDDGGTLTAGDFDLFVNGDPVTSGVTNTLQAGVEYTVSETEVTGYELVGISGDCAPDGTITLELGEEATCFLINDDQPGTLTVIKEVINDNGGTAQVSDFPLFVDGDPVTSGVANTLDAGDHTVSETEDPGYAATISGDCDSDGSITLNAGDVKECTITNDDIAPTLLGSITIVKDAPGKPNHEFRFTGDLGNFGLAHGGSKGFSNLAAGDYTVAEDPGSFPDKYWALLSVACQDQDKNLFYPDVIDFDSSVGAIIPLQSGQHLTCTFFNDRADYEEEYRYYFPLIFKSFR